MGLLRRENTVEIALSDFPSDNSELAHSSAVAKIKIAAAEGRVVLLTNASPIASAIFDLLNRRYTRLVVRGKDVHYANIAVGSFSRPCIVHPNFRIVVHVSVLSVLVYHHSADSSVHCIASYLTLYCSSPYRLLVAHRSPS